MISINDIVEKIINGNTLVFENCRYYYSEGSFFTLEANKKKKLDLFQFQLEMLGIRNKIKLEDFLI